MKYIIFRLDDICPDMNYDKFERIKKLFIKYNIKPLIGIIPSNEDLILKNYRTMGKYIEDAKIWNELLKLHKNQKWDIALHGYNHCCELSKKGLFYRSNKSEFVGLTLDAQLEKINKGKSILSSYGFNVKCFMAPSHSFDDNTLLALNQSGIKNITDGYGVFPYKMKHEIIAFPVPTAGFKNLPTGLYSVCLHTNTMTERDYQKIEVFIKKHLNYCISFDKAVSIADKALPSTKWNIYNFIFEYIMRTTDYVYGKVKKI